MQVTGTKIEIPVLYVRLLARNPRRRHCFIDKKTGIFMETGKNPVLPAREECDTAVSSVVLEPASAFEVRLMR